MKKKKYRFRGYKEVYVDGRRFRLSIDDLKYCGKRGTKDAIIKRLSKIPKYQDPHYEKYTKEELEDLGYDDGYYELDIYPLDFDNHYIATVFTYFSHPIPIEKAIEMGILRVATKEETLRMNKNKRKIKYCY